MQPPSQAPQFDPYRTDLLILLVGGNPLPNYVAAHLLSRMDSQITLIHSDGTKSQAERIKTSLHNEGWGKIDLIEVNESNPSSILREVKNAAKQSASGSIGLNYTGGTKAMSVHSYRTLEQATAQAAQKPIFSYLDARDLSMVFSHRSTPVKINQQVQVSLETLLTLHGLPRSDSLGKAPTIDKPQTIQALVNIFAVKQDRQDFREWMNPNNHFHTNTPISLQILQALQADQPGLDWSQPQQIKAIKKWLDGFWLEEYVFDAIAKLKQANTALSIGSMAMNIAPSLTSSRKGKSFEIDVGFMRGHQFYGISAGTTDDFSKLKLKLFEVSVRARQLGGGEARYALVSSLDKDYVHDLKKQMKGLEIYDHIRVFGADDLPDLQNRLKNWIEESSS